MYKVQTVRPMSMPCGFCKSGKHGFCPGVVLNGDETTALTCPCDGCEVRLRCVNCYIREGVNPTTCTCDDLDACATRIETARKNAREKLFGGHDRPSTPGNAPRSTKTPRSARPTRAGQCLCCGEATKGGLFLPGHDSKYLNARVEDISGVTAPGDVEDRMRADGCSDALIAKFRKRVAA